jgi:predicted DNA-binding helix-hairpin-helix protein
MEEYRVDDALNRKLKVLADAAKYDASCAPSAQPLQMCLL